MGTDHFHGHALNKFFGVDAALQFDIGKVGTKGMQPGIDIRHHRFFEFLPIKSAKLVQIQSTFHSALDQDIAAVRGVTAARHEIKFSH